MVRGFTPGAFLGSRTGAEAFGHFFQAEEFHLQVSEIVPILMGHVIADDPIWPVRVVIAKGLHICGIKIPGPPLTRKGHNPSLLADEHKVHLMSPLVSPVLDRRGLEAGAELVQHPVLPDNWIVFFPKLLPAPKMA